MLHARAVLDLADALDERARAARRHRGCWPTSSCRWSTCWPRWSRPASPSTSTTSRRSRATSPPRCATPPSEAFAVIGKEINLGSPKQLQVVLFDELGMPKTKRTKTGYTTDADALQALYEKTEHPFLMALLRHRDVSRLRQTIEGLLKTVQSDGRIHTTFNQTIAATGRLSSHRPQPAEHPDPHRGGPADPRGLRGRRGLRLPADRRLQPDRDADHGPPLRGRRADRGVPVRARLPLDHRVPGLRRRRPTRSPPGSGPRSRR